MALQIWRAYIRILDAHPWKMHAFQTGALMGVGDALSQTLVEGKHVRNCELARISRFAAMGFFFVGPSLRGWYMVLDKLFGTSGKTAVIKKVALDQTCFAPLLLLNIVVITNLMQRKTWGEIKQVINEDYFSIVKANWKLWPATQLINFYFVPLQHRVTVVNVVCIFWNIYLAGKANAKR